MPLHPENSYGLDVAIESGSISSDLYLAANMGMIDDAAMERIMEQGYASESGSFEGMVRGFDGLYEYLADKVIGLPGHEQFAIQFLAALNLSEDIRRMSEKAASLVVESRLYHAVLAGEITQASLEEAQDRFFCPTTNRVLGRLGSGFSAFLQDDSPSASEDLPEVALPEVCRDKDMLHPAVLNNILLHPELQKTHRSLMRTQDTLIAFGEDQDLRSISSTLSDIHSRNFWDQAPDPAAKSKHKLVSNKKQGLGKKILRRSMNVFKQLIGSNELKAFLNGDGINVEGHYFNYLMKRNPQVDLVQDAYHPVGVHIPYKLTLLDKESGLEMTDICVYFEGTPAIDQVAAMIMHIQSGEEKAILQKANIFNVRPDFSRVVSQLLTEDPDGSSVLERFNDMAERIDATPAESTIDAMARSHPGHQLYNETVSDVRQVANEHFKKRLGLEPWLMELAELGSQHHDHMPLIEQLKEAPSALSFESYTASELGLEFSRPTVEAHPPEDTINFGRA